jgi:hypothetical protein
MASSSQLYNNLVQLFFLIIGELLIGMEAQSKESP